MNVRAALHRLYLILKSNNMLSNFTLESEKGSTKCLKPENGVLFGSS